MLTTLHQFISDWRILTILEVLWVIIAAVVILLQRRSAAATIAWLLALTFLPLFGLLIYRLIGPLRLKKRRMRHRSSRMVVENVTGTRGRMRQLAADTRQVANVPVDLHEAPPLFADRVDSYLEGAELYEALAAAIELAQNHIHLEYYIWEPDHIGLFFRDLLIKKARAGVKVRLLVDGTGSARIGRKFLKPLLAAGIEFARFNPVSFRRIQPRRIDFRTHRKIVVCDGRVGFAGGMNITDVQTRQHSSAAWRDTHLRLEGAAVWPLQRMFLEDWHFATEVLVDERDTHLFAAPHTSHGERALVQVVGSGPDHDLPTMLHTFFVAITRAEKRLWITTPYFVPEESIAIALSSAALRRVDVRLLIPKRSDSRLIDYAARSYLPELIQSGVHVYEYQPRFIHAKTWVIDDELSIVGSSNVDTRSTRLNFELVALLYDRPQNTKLAAAFLADQAQSRKLEASELSHLTLPQRLAHASARLLSPLL